MATTTVNFLIISVRTRIGDRTAPYRYDDAWIVDALLLAVKGLQRYWNYRYLVDATTNEVSRNSYVEFLFPEPPVIQSADEDIIVLAAAIVMLEGSFENSAWNAVSWRDNEIAYSNLEQFRSREGLLGKLADELYSKIKPPREHLIWPSKQSLPGYKGNRFETVDKQ
jgi:hypothetical protein